MADKVRGNDAQDHAPRADPPAASKGGEAAAPSPKQDAANYEKRTDAGQAIEVENLSSADDEGAN